MDISSERLRISEEDDTAKIETEDEYLEYIKDGSRPKKNAEPYRVTICWFTPFFIPWIKLHPKSRSVNMKWARRLVVCHNACLGISTDDLEQGRVKVVRRNLEE